MRAAQVSSPGGPFEIVERSIPEPASGTVRIKVQACGVCHSVSLVKEGHMPGIQYPRVPGHEVVGIIDAVGAGVSNWTAGQRVGEVQITDPVRAGFATADIRDGDVRVGDEAR